MTSKSRGQAAPPTASSGTTTPAPPAGGPAPRRRRTSVSSIQNLSTNCITQADYRGQLVPATHAEERQRPGYADHRPTDIFIFILFKKVRNINVIRASVGVRFILSLQWEAPHLKGKRVDESNLWRPHIDFLNNDGLTAESEKCHFYPETGDVKMILVMDGNMSNEMSLRRFPWDFDDVNLLIVSEMDTFDRNCRLFWQSARDIKQSTPKFLDRQLSEWKLDHDLNFLHRLPKIPGGMVGPYNGLEFKFHLEREEGFYVVKILSIIAMLTAMSFCTMMIYDFDDAEMADVGVKAAAAAAAAAIAAADNQTQTLTGGLRYIGVGTFTDRINLSCAVLLACVAFQYLISENLPKTGYMTTMDNLLMTSFTTIFGGALETVIVRALSAHGNHALGEQIDRAMIFVAPAAYALVSAGFIISAIMGRRRERHATIQRRKSKQNGVDPSLLIANTAAVQSVVSASGFRQMHSSDDRHLVEEVIDDVNAVEAFEREATKILPVGGGAQPQRGRSARSLFHL
jgi:hypothetical protein